MSLTQPQKPKQYPQQKVAEDLREWIDQVEALGELRHVDKASCNLEIGTIVDIAIEKVGRPAFLFNHIPSFAAGRRVLGNVLTSPKRVALASGMDPETEQLDIVQKWRKIFARMKQEPIHEISDGPILQNIQSGKQVDLNGFPAPYWHEKDGGQFIGTGCLVVMRDPDSGWINTGTYRIQVHDERTTGILITRGRHGDVIMRKYWEKGESCPVAVVAGGHPLFVMLGGIPIGDSISEYDVVGGIWGHPVDVVKTPAHSLPVPASAELVLEGTIPYDMKHPEGPFGEWTGYYAAPLKDEPIIKVENILYRDNPINLGIMPGMPPNDNTYFLNYLQSALVWSQMEAAGVSGIQSVWAHEAGGSRMWQTVSINQLHPGHSKQAGLLAATCRAGGYVNRVTVVVDEDIDSTNIDEVIWAISTRFDPREDLETLHKCHSSPLDPMSYPDDTKCYNSRIIIDACIPWEKRNQFPAPARASKDLRKKTWEKWHHLFE